MVSLRRGVASRGFAPVALAEPVPFADLLALAQNPVRAESLLAVRLVGKHGQGPSGKVLLRLVRGPLHSRALLPRSRVLRRALTASTHRRAVCRGHCAIC